VEDGRDRWYSVVGEIRIYVEGGGDSKDTKAFLREGFSTFLRDLVSLARSRRVRWQLVTCGSRNAAFDAFSTSVRQNPQAFNVLLVDSEAPVTTTPWAHLRARDQWNSGNLPDDHCHLMVQAMEAWFVSDVEALVRFYGEGFYRNSIPNTANVEQIPRTNLEPSLKAATRNTQTKGEYKKIHHASKLLALINPATVRGASSYCERLFAVLASKMN
jgi:hypothetical protein